MPEDGCESFEYMPASALVCEQFGFPDIDAAGIGDQPGAVAAAGALLEYIRRTQKMDMRHIRRLDVFFGGRFMELDYVTRRNLELTESLRSGEKKGSLLWVLDRTRTPMGGRLLRAWVERPLLSAVAIRRRLNAVSELVGDNVKRGELRETLRGIGDMQRLVGRAVYGTAGGRDLRALALSAAALPWLRELLADFKCLELRDIGAMDALEDLRYEVDRAICDDPPFSVREGGILRPGYSEEVDRLRNVRDNGAKMVQELEARERERTGIKKLKVGYNKVFGYYIDVPKSAGLENVPEDYIRKQTLVSNERYFTQELKELENTLLTAKDRINDLEYRYFCEVRDSVAAKVERVQAGRRRGGAARRPLLSRGGRRAQQLHLPRDRHLPHPAHRPGPPPRGGAEHEGRALRPERHLPERSGRPRRHRDRPQHGGQIHLYAPDGPDRPDGADGLLRPGKVRRRRHRGPGLHAHRRVRRSGLRPVHLHGGDERDRRHLKARHRPVAPDPRRDRARHLHL